MAGMIHPNLLSTRHSSHAGLARPVLSLNASTHRRQGLCARAAGAGTGGSNKDPEEFQAAKQRQEAPFPGVSLDGRTGKFRASIPVNGREVYLGLHATAQAAAAAVKAAWQARGFVAARYLGSEGGTQHLGLFQTEAEAAAACAKAARKDPFAQPSASSQPKSKSLSWGVVHPKKKWSAQTHWNGKTHYLGAFDDERDAARAVRASLDSRGDGWRTARSAYLGEDGEATA